jgi:hypothetical protein
MLWKYLQLKGSTLRVETDTLIRPLANMNYRNAEDKARVNNISI